MPAISPVHGCECTPLFVFDFTLLFVQPAVKKAASPIYWTLYFSCFQAAPVSTSGGSTLAPAPPASRAAVMVAPAVVAPAAVTAAPFQPPSDSVLHQDLNSQVHTQILATSAQHKWTKMIHFGVFRQAHPPDTETRPHGPKI